MNEERSRLGAVKERLEDVGMGFGCIDVAKVFAPPIGGVYGGIWAVRHFGPYPHHLNGNGHSPVVYFVLGFVVGFALVVGLWECLMALLMRADARARTDRKHRPHDNVDGGRDL